MNTRILVSTSTCLALGLCMVACDRRSDPAAGTGATKVPATGTMPAPDNTARNRADDSTRDKTPMDQSNASADIKITADIRRAIMDDKNMSTNAQNCKIITDKAGIVTLRGPVNSQAEKDAIAAKAQAIAGVTKVVNELEVKTN